MKKWLLAAICSMGILSGPAWTAGAEESGISDFKKDLEEKLLESESYYNKQSVTLGEYETFPGEVTKITTTDDPDTPENEEETESYETNIVVAVVEYRLVRDKIFYSDKSDLYFYDLDNKEFLTYSDVFQNEKADSFFKSHIGNLHTNMTLWSKLIITLFIMGTCFIPFLLTALSSRSSGSPYRKASTEISAKY